MPKGHSHKRKRDESSSSSSSSDNDSFSSGEDEWTDSDLLRDYDGTPFISGTSLAGAMRAYLEKEKKDTALSKVLGPMHIWALGVGIVLVGEFMGWNYTVAKGGSLGSLIALWTVAMFYIMIVMMNTEMGSVMPEAGGQYTMAKYLLGPLAAFNVGLMLVFEYDEK